MDLNEIKFYKFSFEQFRQDCQQLCKSINLEGGQMKILSSQKLTTPLIIKEKCIFQKDHQYTVLHLSFPLSIFTFMIWIKPLDVLKVTELMKERELQINGAEKNIELIQDVTIICFDKIADLKFKIKQVHPVLGLCYLTFHQCRMKEVIEQIQQLQVNQEQNKYNKQTEEEYSFSPTITSLMILLKEFNIYFPKEIYKQLQIN